MNEDKIGDMIFKLRRFNKYYFKIFPKYFCLVSHDSALVDDFIVVSPLQLIFNGGNATNLIIRSHQSCNFCEGWLRGRGGEGVREGGREGC